MKHATLRFRTHVPDYSNLPDKVHDWSSVYGEVQKLLTDDTPPPLGKQVTLTHYVDANLFHDALSGRSVTGILHMMNATPAVCRVDYLGGLLESSLPGPE